jgi:hypothetical protein
VHDAVTAPHSLHVLSVEAPWGYASICVNPQINSRPQMSHHGMKTTNVRDGTRHAKKNLPELKSSTNPLQMLHHLRGIEMPSSVWIGTTCRTAGVQFPAEVKCLSSLEHRQAPNSPNFLFGKMWSFHGGDYEEWRLLGSYAVWLL